VGRRGAQAGHAVILARRQYLGCVGKVAKGINTVHLPYVREGTGRALIGAREWVPAEHIDDPVRSLAMGVPAELVFRTKGQLGIDILAEGVRLDFVCGDVVLGLAFGDLPESEQRSCRGLWLVFVGGMPSALDHGNGRMETAGHLFLHLGRPSVVILASDDKYRDRCGRELSDAIGLV
jgi:SRSO17 transposase